MIHWQIIIIITIFSTFHWNNFFTLLFFFYLSITIFFCTNNLHTIICLSSKLARKEYKTRYDWVVKVIHWELCKKLKVDHTNKWYMLNIESVLKNKTHKILWGFEIQTDHLTSARRPGLVIVNKKRKEKENVQNCELRSPD